MHVSTKFDKIAEVSMKLLGLEYQENHPETYEPKVLFYQ